MNRSPELRDPGKDPEHGSSISCALRCWSQPRFSRSAPAARITASARSTSSSRRPRRSWPRRSEAGRAISPRSGDRMARPRAAAVARACPIKADVAPNLGAAARRALCFRGGTPTEWTMNIQGSRERILDSVLPHEITHTIFATHFGRPLPRWADEGACTTVEHDSEKAKQDNFLIQFLHARPRHRLQPHVPDEGISAGHPAALFARLFAGPLLHRARGQAEVRRIRWRRHANQQLDRDDPRSFTASTASPNCS